MVRGSLEPQTGNVDDLDAVDRHFFKVMEGANASLSRDRDREKLR
ncbi:MAG: hypothetical protein QOC81_3721 [Thermoanaerobaculia bacterium]|jgi:hypothetical protein|nr:hypothetical protein [Thermoanaerobaculia bacterium]